VAAQSPILEPGFDPVAPLQLLVASLDYDNYLGRLAIGRVVNGAVKPGQNVSVCRHDGTFAKARVTKVMSSRG